MSVLLTDGEFGGLSDLGFQSFESKIECLKKSEEIISKCKVSFAQIKRQSLLRVFVHPPNSADDHEYLYRTYASYRTSMSKKDCRRRRVFWIQCIKWSNSDTIPSVDTLGYTKVASCILHSFKMDLQVCDDRISRYWRDKYGEAMKHASPKNSTACRRCEIGKQDLDEMKKEISRLNQKNMSLLNELNKTNAELTALKDTYGRLILRPWYRIDSQILPSILTARQKVPNMKLDV